MRVLIVDDDTNQRKVLAYELSSENCITAQAECGDKALKMIEKEDFDVLLLDLGLPDISGQMVLQRIKSQDIPIEIVILTGYGSISTVVETMRMGAYDYVTKPYDINRLAEIIKSAAERKMLLSENQSRNMQEKKSNNQKLVTNNRGMLSVLEKTRTFAQSDFPVMLLGESGVGKELLAEEVHKASPRANGPLIPINCGAIPENVIESELFGHEKGAFTSAHIRKLGLLEIADGGTLFLDEIGELPYNLQQKLLRVIDIKRFYRVGGTKQIKVDVRFVSATNKDLEKEMKNGRFRQDLFYRLTTLTVEVPPLRARQDDIPLLVEHIIRNTNNYDLQKKRFSEKAMKKLQNYSWQGNIRELQNVINRTLLLSERDVIGPEDLPLDLLRAQENNSRSLQDVERNHIAMILNEVDGKKGEAAKILGIDPKTLYRKMSSFSNEVGAPVMVGA